MTGACLTGVLNFIVNSGTLALILAYVLKIARREDIGADPDTLAQRLAYLEEEQRRRR